MLQRSGLNGYHYLGGGARTAITSLGVGLKVAPLIGVFTKMPVPGTRRRFGKDLCTGRAKCLDFMALEFADFIGADGYVGKRNDSEQGRNAVWSLAPLKAAGGDDGNSLVCLR